MADTQIIITPVPGPVIVVTQGLQGPPGIPGQQFISYLTAQALGGQRVVYLFAAGLVDYLDPNNLLHCLSLTGLTMGAAGAGATVLVQAFGEMTEPSWAWTPEQPVYAGANGVLTQVLPTGGCVLILGIAVTPTTLFLNPQFPIVLAG